MNLHNGVISWIAQNYRDLNQDSGLGRFYSLNRDFQYNFLFVLWTKHEPLN
jgi:hypothetical protein